MYTVLLTKNSGRIVGPIATALGWIMNGIFHVLSKIGLPNIGLAIILMTILVNVLMLPLTYRQQKFSKLQNKMQPEMKKIQDKYRGKNDEGSLAAQQSEMKELYAKYGVNPTGSCIQLLIQMPILFGLYRVFYNIPAYLPLVKQTFFPLVDDLIAQAGSSEFLQTLSGASTFVRQFENENFVNGVTEYVQNTFIDVLNKCSTADWTALAGKFTSLSDEINTTAAKIAEYNNFLGLNLGNSPSFMLKSAWANGAILACVGALLVPALAALSQYLSIKVMPSGSQNSDPNDSTAATMRTMKTTMPLMSAFFCFTLPAGLGIYWIASAVVRTIVSIFVNRHIDKMDIDAMIAENIEKAKAKGKISENKKKDVPSRTVNQYSSMSTKNIKKTDKYSTRVSNAREKELESMKNNGKKYRKGSLTAIANMNIEAAETDPDQKK